MTEWKIEDDILISFKDGNKFYPSAQEVFSLVKEGNPPLSQIRFSSLGCNLTASLQSSENSLVLSIEAEKRGKKKILPIVNGKLVDHVILCNTWYHVNKNLDDLEGCLAEAAVYEQGTISRSQYVKIKQYEFTHQVQLFDDFVEFDSNSQKNGLDINPSEIPLRATLFEYQHVGFNWICNTLDGLSGCVLGDEMGLGKTMQIIATMLFFQQKNKGPFLIVAPISLLANWKRECNKFAPTLNVYVHHGSNRISNYKCLEPYDVVVTSYSTVINDLPMLNMARWYLAVLDEAQNIKNPDSIRKKTCCRINSEKCIAVTGTPFENHITDIWSILDFVYPGVLGDVESFRECISDDVEGGKKLEPILSAMMVRRRVKEVADELPPRIDIEQPLQMSEKEAKTYSMLLSEAKCESESGNPGFGILQKLRMFCTHPHLIDDESGNPFDDSVKFQRFCELVEEIIEKGEKAIVFTSYKKMFDVFTGYLKKNVGVKNWSINGETEISLRQKIVDDFNRYDGSAILFLNPRAAGTGLNITGANHVIHYNLEWNPSLEDQASARAYRRGQEKTVFVYRLYYQNTVEQIIQDRINRKRLIAENAVVGTEGFDNDYQDVIDALNLVPNF